MEIPQEILNETDNAFNLYLLDNGMLAVPFNIVKTYFDSIPVEKPVILPKANQQVFTIDEVRELCMLFHNSIPPRRIINEKDYKILLDDLLPIVKTCEP